MKDRNDHFYIGSGNPILGYSTDEAGVVCRNCAKDNPELVDIDPRTVSRVRLSDVGEGAASYPDGFTCAGCGDVIGAWDYKGGD